MSGRVVYRFREGKRVKKKETLGEATFEFDLQSVIVRTASRERGLDDRKAGNWPARNVPKVPPMALPVESRVMFETFKSGKVKLVWLKILKASARNSSRVVSFQSGNCL